MVNVPTGERTGTEVVITLMLRLLKIVMLQYKTHRSVTIRLTKNLGVKLTDQKVHAVHMLTQ